ncbi:hypothetical protein KUTeg_023217 [Tegillarca granosa]|uniref:Uncharacterized protein n=1 Tax=Tegillarca granosa TaxID=220873 RepID=A0ABQ9E6I8_TEGGR|nr:hypothetical protein KUTeg_023217 [Tegillarca granosa]
MTDRTSSFVLPPPLSSSDDDSDDNNLDLCDTESLWDRKLRNVCKKAKNDKQVEDHCDGSSESDKSVLDNKNICQLVSSNKCKSIDTVSSIYHKTHVKSDITNSESCKLMDKAENTDYDILISDLSDVESDDVQSPESEKSQDKTNKTYKPISDGKWRKQSVPKTAICNQNNIENACASLSSSSCNLSRGVSCSEDVDCVLDDYIESDEENNVLNSITKKQKKEYSNDDDKTFINDPEASYDKPGPSCVKNDNNTDVGLNFREVLLRKRSKPSEKKRKHSSLSDKLSKKLSDESTAKQKHVSKDRDQVTSPWVLKTKGENSVTGNTNVLDGRQDVSVKSPLKRTASNQTFPNVEEANVEGGISSIKKSRKNTTDCTTSQAGKSKMHTIKTTPSKLNIVSVSQEEINKVNPGVSTWMDSSEASTSKKVMMDTVEPEINVPNEITVNGMSNC